MLYGNEAFYRLQNLRTTNQISEIKQICHLSRICNEIAFVYIALRGRGRESSPSSLLVSQRFKQGLITSLVCSWYGFRDGFNSTAGQLSLFFWGLSAIWPVTHAFRFLLRISAVITQLRMRTQCKFISFCFCMPRNLHFSKKTLGKTQSSWYVTGVRMCSNGW